MGAASQEGLGGGGAVTWAAGREIQHGQGDIRGEEQGRSDGDEEDTQPGQRRIHQPVGAVDRGIPGQAHHGQARVEQVEVAQSQRGSRSQLSEPLGRGRGNGARPREGDVGDQRNGAQGADEDGLEALTMRRLAADLGVEAASIYHHVSGKAELLDGVLALMRREMTFDGPLPEAWPDLIEVVFLRYLEVLMAHPHLLPLAGRHLDSDPAEGLPYLVQHGLTVGEAAELWQGLLVLTVGFAIFATRAFERQSDYLGGELADAMTIWPTESARQALRSIVAAYVDRR